MPPLPSRTETVGLVRSCCVLPHFFLDTHLPQDKGKNSGKMMVLRMYNECAVSLKQNKKNKGTVSVEAPDYGAEDWK